MSDRIRQLEDALEVLQRERTDQSHPLLHKDLLAIKNLGDTDPAERTDAHGQALSIEELDDAFGTLAISQSGVSHFVGRSGGTEVSVLF